MHLLTDLFIHRCSQMKSNQILEARSLSSSGARKITKAQDLPSQNTQYSEQMVIKIDYDNKIEELL